MTLGRRTDKSVADDFDDLDELELMIMTNNVDCPSTFGVRSESADVISNQQFVVPHGWIANICSCTLLQQHRRELAIRGAKRRSGVRRRNAPELCVQVGPPHTYIYL